MKHIARRGKHIGKWVRCEATVNCRNGGEHVSDEIVQHTRNWLQLKDVQKSLDEINLTDYQDFVKENPNLPIWNEQWEERYKPKSLEKSQNDLESKFKLEPNVTCAECRKPFHLRKSKIDRNRNGLFFCTVAHRDAYRKGTGKSVVQVNCTYCGKALLRRTSETTKSKNFYCDNSHLAKHKTQLAKTEKSACKQCNRTRLEKNLIEGLCFSCRERNKKIADWLAGDLSVTYTGKLKEPSAFVKEYVIQIRGDRCEECGFSGNNLDGRSIIQMDHVDGNYLNNKFENLKLLCPTHHAMTLTFGSRNKNIGRRKMAKILLDDLENQLTKLD